VLQFPLPGSRVFTQNFVFKGKPMANGSDLRSWGTALLRVVVGTVFLMHGGQKFSMGFHAVAGFLSSIRVPAPEVAAILLTLLEFFGGIALVFGVFTRWIALLLAFDMAVAVLAVHLKNGFFNPAGVEFPLTLFAASVCLALSGSGAAAVDRMMGKKATPKTL
jgi:putative oxidoreductase